MAALEATVPADNDEVVDAKTLANRKKKEKEKLKKMKQAEVDSAAKDAAGADAAEKKKKKEEEQRKLDEEKKASEEAQKARANEEEERKLREELDAEEEALRKKREKQAEKDAKKAENRKKRAEEDAKKAEEEPPAPVVQEPAQEADDSEAQVEDDKPEEKVKEVAPEPQKAAPELEVAAPADDDAAAGEEEEVAEVAEVKDVKEGDVKEPDSRLHMNVVFIGHVDAGKSTTCGSILYLSNCVDERTIEKYQKEAKDKNRESWFLAYIMDTSEEEKAKGKTVEVGRAHFETTNKRFTILDAPGHKSYVPNMIAGASQADVGVLIISARKGEFETGFERGGQTREHALLAKTLGVEKLCVAINKMDDPTVEWKQERYDSICGKLAPFLKTAGFKEDQVTYLPISGLKGDNIKEKKNTPSWFTGKSLLEALDGFEIPGRKRDADFRIPMLDGYKDMGATMCLGKVEQGVVKPGTKCIIMPIGQKCTIVNVNINDEPMQYANCGENVTIKLSGCSEEELKKGYVLCPIVKPIRVISKFKAQMQVLELSEERPVLTSGYKAIFHVHVATEECEILKLYEASYMTNMKRKEKNPCFVREGSVLTCSIAVSRSIALDCFSSCEGLGRFTLRDEGRTIAIGRITELPKEEEVKDNKKK